MIEQWMLLALLGALFQAVNQAIKKVALRVDGMNNVIAFLSCIIAGIIFASLHWYATGTLWHSHLSPRFWNAMQWLACANILASWCLYRALDKADLSFLMPFSTLTVFFTAAHAMIMLGERPTAKSLSGMVLIVAGAIAMAHINRKPVKTMLEQGQRQGNWRGLGYFLVTSSCFVITPAYTKIATQESSALFTSLMTYCLMSAGFLLMIVVFREMPNLARALQAAEHWKLRTSITLLAIVYFVENLSVTVALSQGPVASVMGLKRLMPIFAFLIGVAFFHERDHLLKKAIATLIMVAGAFIIAISQ